ncbi:MAG: pilus assembly protein PilP [Halomonadaceae bacterium]|nr:MAG: pilus assembly protein PilP [Halomonadaceae bacterium]
MSCPSVPKVLTSLLVVVIMTGCSQDSGYTDLDQFMSAARDAPRGVVEPLPEFQTYEAFRYGAADRRAPFEPPQEVQLSMENAQQDSDSNIRPDENRSREPLERFEVGRLTMVGTLQRTAEGEEGLYALIADGSGGIHRVTRGNYMGENHGRIRRILETRIELIEIISDGRGGWIERPRTVSLEER